MQNILRSQDFLSLIKANQSVHSPDLDQKLFHTELAAVIEHDWFTYDIHSIVIRPGLVLNISKVTSHTSHVLEFAFPYDIIGFTYGLKGSSTMHLQQERKVALHAGSSVVHVFGQDDHSGYVHRQEGEDITFSINFTIDAFRDILDVPDSQLPEDVRSFFYGHKSGAYQAHRLSSVETNILYDLLDIDQTGLSRQFFVESKVLELISIQLEHLTTGTYQEKTTPQEEKLQQCRTMLIDNYSSPPSLIDLTKEVGINICDLKMGFKALYGVPPYQYLKNFRLDRAHEMLQTGLSVNEVADEIGYASISSFSNAFYQKFNQRPSTV